jgi:predicted Zn-dependent peptidase
MIHTFAIAPGITLRCFPDDRFKQACMSVQLLRPVSRQEAAFDALLPSVLLRGCESAPDLRAIARRTDDLYGASVGSCIRRLGDWQTTGLACGFVEDRFALAGDRIMEPTVALLQELLLHPVLENGVFRQDVVETERKSLVLTIESEINDKRSYAQSQLLRKMCGDDPYAIPRLGEKEDVERITSEDLYAHYRRILKESPIEVTYVGSMEPEAVAQLVRGMFRDLERDYVNLPAQTSFRGCEGGEYTEQMDVTQGKLSMGFVTPIWDGDDRVIAMRLLNIIFGAGMTSKLFMNVREKLSLCYDIGSSYISSKGLLTVGAGIDCDNVEEARQEIMNQLTACQEGRITAEELEAAKQFMGSSMRAVYDSTGAIEYFYSMENLSVCPMSPEQIVEAVEKVTLDDVVAAARTLRLHTVYFLEGVNR